MSRSQIASAATRRLLRSAEKAAVHDHDIGQAPAIEPSFLISLPVLRSIRITLHSAPSATRRSPVLAAGSLAKSGHEGFPPGI